LAQFTLKATLKLFPSPMDKCLSIKSSKVSKFALRVSQKVKLTVSFMGLAGWWMAACFLRFEFCVKLLLHLSHLYGFSLVCTRKWYTKFHVFENSLFQLSYLHTYYRFYNHKKVSRNYVEDAYENACVLAVPLVWIWLNGILVALQHLVVYHISFDTTLIAF